MALEKEGSSAWRRPGSTTRLRRRQRHVLARREARHVHHAVVVYDRDDGTSGSPDAVEAVRDTLDVRIAAGVRQHRSADAVCDAPLQQPHLCDLCARALLGTVYAEVLGGRRLRWKCPYERRDYWSEPLHA